MAAKYAGVPVVNTTRGAEFERMDVLLEEQVSTLRCARAVRCCRGGRCVLALAFVAGGGKVLWWDWLPKTHPALLWPRQIASSNFYNALLQPSATSRKGREYLAEQMPLIEASALDFECADYWCKNMSVHSIHIDWYALITKRYENMLRHMRADPRADDFKMEKNKCDMYDWFEKSGYRTMKVVYRWSARGEWGLPAVTHDAVIRDLLEGKTKHPFPLFLKTCHITQGWMHSTKLLESEEAVTRARPELEAYVQKMWEARANDWERPWAVPHNAMTDTLGAGSMVQELFRGSFSQTEAEGAVVEMKVYIIWGRVYCASIHDIVILRDGTMELYGERAGTYMNIVHGAVPSPYLRWVVSEGHLKHAILFAETAALVAGMDMVRFDFFLRKGDPDGITINENSISSARNPIYHHHFDNMAMAWAKGHVKHWYKPFHAHGMRTYEFSLKDPSSPNHRRISRMLGDNADLAQKLGLSTAASG